MGAVESLMSSLWFFYPPGSHWRALVPLVAAAWVVLFGFGPAVALWRLRWDEPPMRRAVIWMWAALLPNVALALEYAVRALTRSPGDLRTAALVFIPNALAPVWVIMSFLASGVVARPVSFQLARLVTGFAWAAAWVLWATMTFFAFMAA